MPSAWWICLCHVDGSSWSCENHFHPLSSSPQSCSNDAFKYRVRDRIQSLNLFPVPHQSTLFCSRLNPSIDRNLLRAIGGSACLMRFIILSLTLLSVSAGCMTSLLDSRMMKQYTLEQRIINQFADSLKEDNEAALRRTVSTRFEQKALRSETAFKDLEIVSLPKTDLSVVEAEEVNATTRRAIVTDGDDDKYQILLVRDPVKRRWVVDDITSRQQKKGTRAAKSCTEVMDLLLTLREFLETWQNGDREDVLNVLSDDLRSSLEELPDAWLQQLVQRVTREYELAMARRPEAQMNENDAVVKLPARNGFLLVKVDRVEDRWLVSDVEVHNRRLEDHPGSIRRQANAMAAVTTFLEGYNQKDFDKLASAASADFFQGALRYADLTLIQLPSASKAPEDFEIKSFAGKLTVMIPDKSSMVRLDLTESTNDEGKTTSTQAAETTFVVHEVTLYDRQTMQQRNLSSAFTGPARAMLFMTALEQRDVQMLRAVSSLEFSKGTWERIPERHLAMLSTRGVPGGELTLIGSRVKGRDTELDFKAESGQLLSILMTDENGDLKVTDVQFPNETAEIVSLKNQMELAIPVLEYANAWRDADLDGVKRNSSTEFNRLVWSNVEGLPEGFSQLPGTLSSPVKAFRIGGKNAIARLQASNGTLANIRLVQENDYWVVDEISFSQPEGQTVDLRATLRAEIAQRFLDGPSGTIQQASHLTSSTDSATGGGVVHAHAESFVARRGNLTLPSNQAAPAKQLSFALDHLSHEANADELAEQRSQSGIVPATLVEEEVLYFGPKAVQLQDKSGSRPSATEPLNHPAATHKRSTDESEPIIEEINGVTYFRAAPSVAHDTAESRTSGVTAVNKTPMPQSVKPMTGNTSHASERNAHPVNSPSTQQPSAAAIREPLNPASFPIDISLE